MTLADKLLLALIYVAAGAAVALIGNWIQWRWIRALRRDVRELRRENEELELIARGRTLEVWP